MRFIGNKESIKNEIYALLKERELLDKGFSFFDAFCGSGTVADFVKGHFDIIINDILSWCVIYTKGRLIADRCGFSLLSFDPFEYLNNNKDTIDGFFYNNFSPGGSYRMYFTSENAKRIDYFRAQIESWKNADLVTNDEYTYLLACLIESVSHVSNTAGVYGAYLKEWDHRALKPIHFIKLCSLDMVQGDVCVYNERVEDIIADIECDVLYLDPPYTQNQYGTQYHLLETLVLDDNPRLSAVTGSRPVTPMRSDWSKEYRAHILFDRIIAKTKAKHIVLSYNSDGIMSKDYIEACLKRYGVSGSYVCKRIAYKKYRNWKTTKENEHFEYIFYIEKKPDVDVVYECPLNYIGSKANMIDEIRKNMPSKTIKVIDAFGGGFNVGVNLQSEHTAYNDMNCYVTQLIMSFRDTDTYEYLLYLQKLTKKYNLERSNGDSYRKARADYNSLPIKKRDPKFLFVLILYSFQQQIRFNGDHKFNNPVGNRWFNDRVLEKMISFSRRLRECNCDFYCYDFQELDSIIDSETFVYLDPPYRLTCGAYNDGKRGFEGWTVEHETALFRFIDRLDSNNIPFMLSYVLENEGIENTHFHSWLNDRDNYAIIEIPSGQGRYGNRKEVLIVNDRQTTLPNKEQVSKI